MQITSNKSFHYLEINRIQIIRTCNKDGNEKW